MNGQIIMDIVSDVPLTGRIVDECRIKHAILILRGEKAPLILRRQYFI